MDMRRFSTNIYVHGDDYVLALGSALQASTHVTRLCIVSSLLESMRGFSTMEEYLKSTKNLKQLVIFPPYRSQLEIKDLTDRLFLAIQGNSSIQELEVNSTLSSYDALSRYLSTSKALQVLRFKDTENIVDSDLQAQTVGRAIQQCQTLKEIDLQQVPESWLVSILQDGLKNHPSVQRLSLRFLTSQDLTAPVALALGQVLHSSTPLRSLQFIECHLPHPVMRPIMEGLWHHPTVESVRIHECPIPDDDAVQALKKFIESSHEKLQSLFLHGNMNFETRKSFLVALQQNTCLKCLDLGADYHPNKGNENLTLVENILRSNPRLMHLSVEDTSFSDPGAAVSFMKTALYDSSLTTLDFGNTCFFDRAMENVTSWSMPKDPTKESKLFRIF
jgi:hypothetical protein